MSSQLLPGPEIEDLSVRSCSNVLGSMRFPTNGDRYILRDDNMIPYAVDSLPASVVFSAHPLLYMPSG